MHLPLIMGKNEDGSVSKLSKRHGARSVVEYQNDGLLPHALVNCLVRLAGRTGIRNCSPCRNSLIFLMERT